MGSWRGILAKAKQVGKSILPVVILLLLTPLVFFGIWLIEDIRWQVGLATVWIWGGLYVAGWFHVVILLGEKK